MFPVILNSSNKPCDLHQTRVVGEIIAERLIVSAICSEEIVDRLDTTLIQFGVGWTIY